MMEQFLGRWRMTKMSAWDNEFMDAEMPAYIEFESRRRGSFHFGYVDCGISWEVDSDASSAVAEFTFEGHDEMHPTSGRGKVQLKKDGTLKGRLVFHAGDSSEFWAIREARPRG
jgi:hypothetical protein